MAYKDTDKGMKKILENMKKLDGMYIKSGFPEGSGTVKGEGENAKEVDIAQIASWLENGTQHMPSRPFVRQAYDNNIEKIKLTQEKLVKLMQDGRIDADMAIRHLAEFNNSLIDKEIESGSFPSLSKKTEKRKKSSRPLIDTGHMKKSIQSVIIKDGAVTERVKK